MWALMSHEQRQTYGEEYFEQAIRSLEKYTKTVSKIIFFYSCFFFFVLFIYFSYVFPYLYFPLHLLSSNSFKTNISYLAYS